MKLRFGLKQERPRTLEEVGQGFALSRKGGRRRRSG